ncbi:hypothetical protein [Flavobacterium sp.]|jgi:hypothetical protein|uniref:hypothetical protein n=1 Tax=Flavobacterium sp. TaxID=239 RepID=UPI003D2D74DA
MKLSKENIQSIDNYLKHEGFIYVDIRMEMVDHIANAVEEKMEAESLNFYDAFKSYMISNKKEIMKQNKEHGFYFKEPILNFIKFCFNPFIFLMGVLIFFSLNFLLTKFGIQNIGNSILWVVLVIYLVFGFWHFLLTRKKMYFYVEKNFWILFLFFHITNLFKSNFNSNLQSAIIFNSLTLFLFLTFILFYFSERRKFRINYKHLFE